MIVYEYPFNERIRTLLRLEDLYKKFIFFLHQENPLQHHIALSTIFEILEVTGRADLKSDLLQELERQKHILLTYQTNPNVEPNMLDAILTEINRVSTNLAATQGKIGHSIRENEWLMNIRSRTMIPGATYKFDLPSYYAWQKNIPEQRFTDISTWFQPFILLFDAVNILIQLLRESSYTIKINIQNGNYQQMLQGKVYQMVRLFINDQLNIIPEISANKHMLWIRFTSQSKDLKLKTFEGEMSFELTLCRF